MKKIANYIVSNFIVCKYFCSKISNDSDPINGDFSIVIISKNRPFSLRSLLLSMEKHFITVPEVNVIIKCSTEKDKDRYEEIKTHFKRKFVLNFYYEDNGFKAAFGRALRGITSNRIMLCVDDQVFTKDINYNEICDLSKNAEFFTLRFGEYTSYSYTLDVTMEQPFNVSNNSTFFLWKCKLTMDDFNYAFSFDATIIDKALLCAMSTYLVYSTPNQLETYMNYSKYMLVFFRFKIGCLRQQSIVNFALNKVQSDNNNRTLGLSLEELNKLYDSNKYVAVDDAFESEFTSCHADFGYVMKTIL